MLIYREETFGPIAAVIVVRRRGRGHRDGQRHQPTGWPPTSTPTTCRRALRVCEALRFAIVGINDINPTSAAAPFGGIKESGLGREGGQEGITEYLDTKLVGLSVYRPGSPCRYHPQQVRPRPAGHRWTGSSTRSPSPSSGPASPAATRPTRSGRWTATRGVLRPSAPRVGLRPDDLSEPAVHRDAGGRRPSLMGAERTTDLVEEAAECGAGGVMTIAGGFSEFGGDGLVLQERLRAAAWAAKMPVIGPNGVGLHQRAEEAGPDHAAALLAAVRRGVDDRAQRRRDRGHGRGRLAGRAASGST